MEVRVLRSALPAQVGGSDVRDKSEFFLLQRGQKFGLPRPHGRIAPVSCLRYAVPRTLGVCWRWEVWGDGHSLRFTGCGSWMNLCHRAGPCSDFICPALGPGELVVWAIRGLPGTTQQPEGMGAALALAGDGPEDALSLVLCAGCRRPVLLITAFRPGLRQSFRWFELCPCVGHYYTKRPIKIETKNCWRWWQMMHLLFAGQLKVFKG